MVVTVNFIAVIAIRLILIFQRSDCCYFSQINVYYRERSWPPHKSGHKIFRSGKKWIAKLRRSSGLQKYIPPDDICIAGARYAVR